MDLPEIIGLVGGFLTTIAYLPQVIKSYKTKSTKDISLPMLIILNIGFIFWLAYGLMINSMPIIASNAVILVLGLSLLAMKLKYW